MSTEIMDIFASGMLIQLSGLLGLGLLLLIAGIQEVRDDRPEAYLYLITSVFLLSGHGVMLADALSKNFSEPYLQEFSIWKWLVLLFAPALIALFLVRAMLNFALYQPRDGLYKLFFGSTLLCYVFMLGQGWPNDVRGILTIVWLALFFKTEFAIAS